MPETKLALPTGSNPARSTLVGAERLINAYVEVAPKSAKGQAPIYAVSGLRAFADVAIGLCRGLYATDDNLFAINGGAAYRVATTGGATQIGIVPGDDRVTMARNRAGELVIQCESGAFLATEASVVKLLREDVLDNLVSVDWLAQRFIFARSDGRFYVSDLDSTDIDPLNFATAEQDPDRLVRGFVHGEELLLMGSRTIEVWGLTNGSGFPFQKLPGAVFRTGLGAKHSVCRMARTVYFVDSRGMVVRVIGGYEVERVSNYELERLIQGLGDYSSLEAFSYTEKGHEFYVLSGPSFTWVYDASTGEWHERKSQNLQRWQANHGAFFAGKNIVGSMLNTLLYEVSDTVYAEDGAAILMEVVFPVLDNFPRGAVVHALHVDCETGVGIETSMTPQPLTVDTTLIGADSTRYTADQTHDVLGLGAGVPSKFPAFDPRIQLDWSDDGAKTFGGGYVASLGRQGLRNGRVSFRRLGSFFRQGRTFRLKIYAPVVRVIAGCKIEVSQRAN